jgi:hypothetical protein
MNAELIQEPDWQYHQRSELSSHDLKTYLDDRVLFFRKHVEKSLVLEESRTPELVFGSDFHRAMEHKGDWSQVVCEEPSGFKDHSFKKEYLDNWSNLIEVPDEVLMNGARRGKLYTEWKKANAENKVIVEKDFDRQLYEKYIQFLGDSKGKTLIKAGKLNKIKEMIETMQRNPVLARWIESDAAERELTILWTHEPSGIRCRSRIDYLTSKKIIDWKTCASCSVQSCKSSIVSYRYDLSAAYYQMAVESLRGEPVPFLWAFSQKTPGFGFRIVNASDWIPRSRDLIDEQLVQLANEDWSTLFSGRAIESIEPPSYSKDVDEVITHDEE